MGWLPRRHIETKSAPRQAVASYQAGRPKIDPWSTAKQTLDAHDGDPTTYRALRAIAENQSRLPIVVRDGDRWTGEPIEDHWLARLMNGRKLNSYETAYVFRLRLHLQLYLSRSGVFIEIVRDRLGNIRELHLLDPDRTWPIPAEPTRGATPDPNAPWVAGFEIAGRDGAPNVRLAPEQVLWVRQPHPLDPYSGSTPLAALQETIRMARAARTFQANFLDNDGMTGPVVAVKGDMDDTVAEELEARTAGWGPARAGRATFLEADGLDIVDLGSKPRDAQHVETAGIAKGETLMTVGVPETVAGDASGRTFSNADAEKEVFWRETMLSDLALIGSAFDELLESDTAKCGWDLSTISVLERDQREREAHLMGLWQAGLITIDEFREGTGRQPLDIAGASDVVYLPVSLVPMHDDMAVPAAPIMPAPTVTPEPAVGNGGGTP